MPCCTCLSGRWTHSQSRQPSSGALWSSRVAILPSDRSPLLLPLLFSTNILSTATSFPQFLLSFSFASLSSSVCLCFYVDSSGCESFITMNSLRSGQMRADPTGWSSVAPTSCVLGVKAAELECLLSGGC